MLPLRRPDPAECDRCGRALAGLRDGERWCEDCAYDTVHEERDPSGELTVKVQRDGGIVIQARAEGDLAFDSLAEARRFLERSWLLLRHLRG